MKEPHLAEEKGEAEFTLPQPSEKSLSQEESSTLLELDGLLEDLFAMEEGLHLPPEANVSLLRRIFSKRAREVYALRKSLDLSKERRDIIASEIEILKKMISEKIRMGIWKETINTGNGKVISILEWLAAHPEYPKSQALQLFIRENELMAEKLEALRASFEASLVPWEQAGLFSEEREKKGFRKPNFETDYLPLMTKEDVEMMESGTELTRGYARAVWSPADVPVASKNAEELTYMKVLKKALLEAYRGTAGGKQPNTLLVGPEKCVLTAKQIDRKQILYQWKRYKQPGLVYNPQKLDPKNHGGKSEAEMVASLKGTEKATGGVFRLERDALIMPKDVGKESMSGRDWHDLIKAKKTLPEQVRAQDAKQALAYTIHCLTTQGWIPDCYDDDDNFSDSRTALAPETYIPDELGAGTVPAFDWDMESGRFDAAGYDADAADSHDGVRGGMRKNSEPD